MFTQSDEIIYGDVLSVSVYKPLAYMEKGEFEHKQIAPRCIAYVPPRILTRLLAKDDVYVVTSRIETYEDEIRECKNPPRNDRLILTEKNECSGTHVFHMHGLLELLKLNSRIVFRMLQQASLPQQEITQETVIKFVKFMSLNKHWDDEAQALIDACFADPSLCLKRNTIILTPELKKTFQTINGVSYEERYQAIQKLDTKSKPKDESPGSCAVS